MPTFSKNSLNAWYKMNGNADDSSGNSNNGTVTNATLTTDEYGVADNAYDFDGSGDFITINNTIGGESEVEIIINAKFDSLTGDRALLSRWTDTFTIIVYHDDPLGARVLFRDQSNLTFESLGSVANTTDWIVYFAGTKPSYQYFQENNIISEERTYNYTSLLGSLDLRIGSNTDGTRQFDGKISEVIIKNKVSSKAKRMFDYANKKINRSLVN